MNGKMQSDSEIKTVTVTLIYKAHQKNNSVAGELGF